MLFVDEGLDEGVVFFADVGFEARCRLGASVFVDAAVFFVAADFKAGALTDFERGSVLREAEAGRASLRSAAAADACCLAASRQFGK